MTNGLVFSSAEIKKWCICPYKRHTKRPECPLNFRQPYLRLIDEWRTRAVVQHTKGVTWADNEADIYANCATELEKVLDENTDLNRC